MTKNELKYLPIDDIIENPSNPQSQTEATFNMLVDDILDNGVISAITVVPTKNNKYMLLGGEHRWRAARVAGETEIPAMILMDDKFTSKDFVDFITVRLNTLQGKLDPQKFFKLYTDLANKHGKDAVKRLMGFANDKALKKLLDQVKKNVKNSLPEEMQQSFEEASSEVHAVEDLNIIVQDMFQKHGKTLNQGFMVFAHGTQSHVYVNMTKKTKKSMDKLLSYCRASGKNINEVLAPVFDERVNQVLVDLEETSHNTKNLPSEAIVGADF